MINAKKETAMRWRTMWWESFYYSNSFTDEKSFDYIKELYEYIKKNSGRADSKEVLGRVMRKCSSKINFSGVAGTKSRKESWK